LDFDTLVLLDRSLYCAVVVNLNLESVVMIRFYTNVERLHWIEVFCRVEDLIEDVSILSMNFYKTEINCSDILIELKVVLFSMSWFTKAFSKWIIINF